MAIFNEAFLDMYKKSKKDNNKKYHEPKKESHKKNVGKTVYKPELKSTNNKDLDSSEREKIRKSEFSKVISLLRESVKEARSKFPNLKIDIKDLKYYKETELYTSYYEDFISCERNTSYIQIASMDGTTREGQEAYDLIVDILGKKVSDSSDLKGTIGTDGYKHDCIIYYESGID